MFTSSVSSQRSKASTQSIRKTPKEYIELEDFLKYVYNNPEYELTKEDKKLLPFFKRGQTLGKTHLDLFTEKDNADKSNKKKLTKLHEGINKILPNLDNKQIQDLARTLMGIHTDTPNQEISTLLSKFGDDKDTITGIFRESLKTSLYKDTGKKNSKDKNYFSSPENIYERNLGTREDIEKTKAKLKIVCKVFTYEKRSTRNDELPKPVQRASSLFIGNNRSSYVSFKSVEDADIITIDTQQYDYRGIKKSKLEETKEDRAERELAEGFKNTDRDIVESLQEPIKKPNYAKHVIDNGAGVGLHFIEKEEEASTPETIHEVSTSKQLIAQGKSKDISFSQMEGFELFDEPEKKHKELTKREAFLIKAMEAWQPVINKAGSNNASFVFKPLEEEVLVKDLCRPDLNPSMSITLSDKRFELIFPNIRDGRNKYIYSLKASSDDIISAVIGLPENNLFEEELSRNPRLKTNNFNAELRDYLLSIKEEDRAKVKRKLYSLIKLAVHQSIGNYINDTLTLSMTSADGKAQDIDTYFPKNFIYTKEVNVNNMSIDYKATQFSLNSPEVPVFYGAKSLGNFSFEIGKKFSKDLPSLLDNGLTITEIFYKDIELDIEIQLFSHAKAIKMKPIQENLAKAENKLIKNEKKIIRVKSGKYAESLREQVESCISNIKLFDEEINAINAYLKSADSVIDIANYPTIPGLRKQQLINFEEAKKESLTKGIKLESELKEVEEGRFLAKLNDNQKLLRAEITKYKAIIQAM